MSSSSTATCCAAPAATSTTSTWPGPWPGSATRSTCSARTARSGSRGSQIHNPDIHGLLPVYVKDPYEGFEVKAFPELTEAELDRYIEANVDAVREVAASGGRRRRRPRQPSGDGPGDPRPRGCRPVRRQDPRLGAGVHGQTPPALPALRLRGHGGRIGRPRRLRPHRRDPSGRLSPTYPSFEDKTRLGPPGVDVDEFRPWERMQGLEHGSLARRSPDPALANRSIFVGKLIVSKGVDLLLAAWPLVRAATPRPASRSPASASTRTGCGGCWRRSNVATSTKRRQIAGRGWALEGGEERAAADPLGLPRRSARRLRRGRPGDGRLGRVHRPARARRGGDADCRAPRRW